MIGNQKPILLTILVMLLAAAACSPRSGAPQTSEEAASLNIDTQVAATVAVQRSGTQTAADEDLQPIPTDTPLPEQQQIDLPTDTQAATFTLEPSQTAIPMVRVSTNTNCRYGPGAVYKTPVGALLVGESAQVVGIPPSPMDYVLIKNPDGAGSCWLWTRYATFNGDLDHLPTVTIPATPTPIPSKTATPVGPLFTISFSNVHDCGGQQYATVKVRNTGSVVLESAEIFVLDLDSSTDLFGPAFYNTPFKADASDCSSSGAYLNLNNSAFVAVSIGAAPVSGHKAHFRLMLCTQDTLGGDCVTNSLNFTIP